jgi:hypothetical protein
MKKLPEIIVTDFISNSGLNDPYCFAFVYSRKGNFLVKGMFSEVKEYIQENLTDALVKYTFFHNGKSRGYWEFVNKQEYVLSGSGRTRCKRRLVYEHDERDKYGRYPGKRKGYVVLLRGEKRSKKLYFKRLPHKWIPEFDSLD